MQRIPSRLKGMFGVSATNGLSKGEKGKEGTGKVFSKWLVTTHSPTGYMRHSKEHYHEKVKEMQGKVASAYSASGKSIWETKAKKYADLAEKAPTQDEMIEQNLLVKEQESSKAREDAQKSVEGKAGRFWSGLSIFGHRTVTECVDQFKLTSLRLGRDDKPFFKHPKDRLILESKILRVLIKIKIKSWL